MKPKRKQKVNRKKTGDDQFNQFVEKKELTLGNDTRDAIGEIIAVKGVEKLSSDALPDTPVGIMADYTVMTQEGENEGSAAVKAEVHAIIGGIAEEQGAEWGATIGTAFAPGLGTVAGAVLGFALGVVVNFAFDEVYDSVGEQDGK